LYCELWGGLWNLDLCGRRIGATHGRIVCCGGSGLWGAAMMETAHDFFIGNFTRVVVVQVFLAAGRLFAGPRGEPAEDGVDVVRIDF